MPALRVKVDKRPGPATRVELSADAEFQDGMTSVLGAVGLGPGEGVLSLNKKVCAINLSSANLSVWSVYNP